MTKNNTPFSAPKIRTIASMFGTRLDIVQAAEIPPEVINWIWAGWLAAGKIHILAGPPGTGKTTLALAQAAMVSRGGLNDTVWPDGTSVLGGRVLIWTGEDGVEDTIIPRLIAAEADMSAVYILRGTTENGRHRPFDFAKDIPALSDEIARLGQVRLVIIDSIAQVVKGDSNKNNDVRNALAPLVELADEHGCAIVGVTHVNKSSKRKEPLDRVNGSLAFGAVARVVSLTAKISTNARPDYSGCVLVRAKSNSGPVHGGIEYAIEPFEFWSNGKLIQTSRVIWRRPIDGPAKEILAWAEGDNSGKNTRPIDVAIQFLKEQLTGGPLPCVEIEKRATEVGISPATLRRARERLGLHTQRQGGCGETAHSMWSLKTPTSHQATYDSLNFSGMRMQPPSPFSQHSGSQRKDWRTDVQLGHPCTSEQRAQLEQTSQGAHVEQLEQVEHLAQIECSNEPSASDCVQELVNYCVEECRKQYKAHLKMGEGIDIESMDGCDYWAW